LPAFALLAAGCASFDSISPGTPSQEVQARVGAPSSVWKNLDGSEVWEYPQGPLGTQTYMVSFGPEHVVRDIRPVLNEGTFSKLRAGMSREEVRRLLGRPAGASFSDRTDEEIWYWRYLEWGVRKMELYAQFDRPTGALKRITRVQIDASGGKPR
jgi:hypothetical protein